MDQSLFLVTFPQIEGEALHWWQVTDGTVVSRGCDIDPLFAAGLSGSVDDNLKPKMVALVPTPLVVMRRHDLAEGLTEQQSSTVAITEGRAQSLDPDSLHWAAQTSLDSADITTASIGIDALQFGLNQLQLMGIDPDTVIPAGCLLEPANGQIMQADFGFETILRSSNWMTWHQSGLREHLVGDQKVHELTVNEIDNLLVTAAAHNGLNFRSGVFAKKDRLTITGSQRKILTWLIAALILITIAIPLIQIAKYHWAADQADQASLEAANTVLDNASDLRTVEQQLDQKMMAEGLGNGKFSVAASGLFSALQQTPGVNIGRLSYDATGVLSAELTALRNEDINPALVALQSSGFKITATPRQDATGTAKADITVRVP